jgi:hypothetical protein
MFDEHFQYNTYIKNINDINDNIDELLYVSKTLDYKRITIFLGKIIVTYNFYKHIDETDDTSEAYSVMDDTDELINNITDCEEYINMIIFLKNYKKLIENTYKKLLANIENIDKYKTEPLNKLIVNDYKNNNKLITSKVEDLKKLIDFNSNNKLTPETEENLNLDIKLITKNDIICIINYYSVYKNCFYKNLHVINEENYNVTKENIKDFKKILYNLYKELCDFFNNRKNDIINNNNDVNFDLILDILKEQGIWIVKGNETIEVNEHKNGEN